MELKSYNTTIATFSEWDKEGKPYFFEVGWESLDEPGKVKSWTGGTRETGVAKFSEAVEKISKFPNCLKIHIVAYSGRTGKKEQLKETIKVNDSYASYPVFASVPERAPEPLPQQPAAAPPPQGNIDFISAILGFDLNGLSGTDKINGLLSFRDKQLETRYEIMDRERERMKLELDVRQLQDKVKDTEEELEETIEENESLRGQVEELTAENQRLQKYIPENSALGVSLTALGSSVLNGFVKKVALGKNADKFASLLGTDVATLKGVFAPEEDTSNPSQAQVAVSPVAVEVVEEEDLTPQRREELAVITHITQWMRSLDRQTLGKVQTLCTMWDKDIETLTQIYGWATGTKNREE